MAIHVSHLFCWAGFATPSVTFHGVLGDLKSGDFKAFFFILRNYELIYTLISITKISQAVENPYRV